MKNYAIKLEDAVRYVRNDEYGCYNGICIKYYKGSRNVYESQYSVEVFTSPTIAKIRDFIDSHNSNGVYVSEVYIDMNMGDGYRPIAY